MRYAISAEPPFGPFAGNDTLCFRSFEKRISSPPLGLLLVQWCLVMNGGVCMRVRE